MSRKKAVVTTGQTRDQCKEIHSVQENTELSKYQYINFPT